MGFDRRHGGRAEYDENDICAADGHHGLLRVASSNHVGSAFVGIRLYRCVARGFNLDNRAQYGKKVLHKNAAR